MPHPFHYCGYQGVRVTSHCDHKELAAQHESVQPLTNQKKVNVRSAYLGVVEIDCIVLSADIICLLSVEDGLPGHPPIYVKEVDALKNHLDPVNQNYDLRTLNALPASQISLAQCEKNGQVIDALLHKADRTAEETQSLADAIVYNAPVDMHYNTTKYINFMHEVLNINNLDGNGLLLSLHNVPNLDNAFYTGAYMVFGNGKDIFFCLASSDVNGHELGHGIVQKVVQSGQGLMYQGHSGAENESFADVFGTAFEWYLATKWRQKAFNWTMGENVTKTDDCLRDMSNPLRKDQPKAYRGDDWVNPNSAQDYGGVHTNSGVGNYCFYRCCTYDGTDGSGNVLHMLQVFFTALAHLSSKASYLEYRDALKRAAQAKGDVYVQIVKKVLDDIGLTVNATNDWKPNLRRAIASDSSKTKKAKK